MTSIFDPSRDTALVDGIQGYADLLLADKPICKRITKRVFDQLVTEGWLTDETRDPHRNEDRPSRAPRRGRGSGPPLFSPSEVEKRKRPAPVGPRPSRRRLPSRDRRRLATAPDSWWKPLGAGDAQHPRKGNITGNVALTHIPQGQDRTTFFREVFFATENWRAITESDGKQTELAVIAADVEMSGHELGRHHLTLVFRPYRRPRGRATTVLRWESVLPELRARNVTDWYLLIERGDDGAYRLRFTPTEPA